MPGSALAKVASFSGGAAFVLGATALIGWITGLRILASVRPDYCPMAPDTGVLFLVYGAIVFSGAHTKGRGTVRTLAVAFAGIAAVYGALKFAGSLLGADLTFGSFLFPAAEKLGPFAFGRMSPYSGLLFFLCGASLLVRILGRDRSGLRNGASILGLVVLVVGGVATTVYLFGSPFLYGGRPAPLAATTAAAFLFLGLGVTAASGKEAIVVRELSGPSARARLLRGILPVIVLAILLDGLLGARLADAVDVNRALLSAGLTLAFMAVTIVVIVRIARSVFRRAEKAESERLRAEEAMRESEERYRSLIENMREGVAYCRMLYDDEGRPADFVYLAVNPAFERLTGLKDVIGRPVTDVIPGIKEKTPELFEAYGRVASTGRAEKFEIDFKPLDAWLSISVYSPGLGHFVAIFDDITFRKRAEENLRESEKRYRLLAENMKDVVWTLDPETMHFTYVSPSVEALRGYTPEEVIARSVYDALVPEGQKVIRQLIGSGLAQFLANPGGDHSYINQVEQPCKDGSTVPTEVVTRFYRDEETGKVLVHGVTRETTGRARAEQALRRSEERFRQIAENADEFIWEVDANGFYTYANPVVEKILGYKPEDLVGKVRFYDLFASDVREELKAGALAAFAQKASFQSFVNPNLRKDGVLVIMETSGSPIVDEAGNLVGYRGADNDITERVRAEEALRDSVKQTEVLMKELQHRVKNSLAVVSGLLGLGLETLTDERAKGIFTETRSRIRSIASLYEQLYSTEDPVSVDLGRYIRQLAESLFKTYVPGTRGIRLKTTLAEVRMDTKRAVPLGLILNELVTNSLKYAYPAGATGEVRIDLARSGDTVALGVSDDGPGLPAGFDLMASGGMGWSLVRMLTEEIGGELSLPAGAQGTRVLIRFKP